MPAQENCFERCRWSWPAVLATVLLAAGATIAREALPELPDQNGDPVGLDASSGRMQVAIVVSAKRLRRIKPWEKALRTDFPDLDVIRIADVPRTSPTDYEKVAKKLRKWLPADLAVGIDLDGEWATTLELDTSVPNLLLFDATGELSFRQHGMFKKDLYEPLQAALNAALEPANATVTGD